jgi:hypothetical protein
MLLPTTLTPSRKFHIPRFLTLVPPGNTSDTNTPNTIDPVLLNDPATVLPTNRTPNPSTASEKAPTLVPISRSQHIVARSQRIVAGSRRWVASAREVIALNKSPAEMTRDTIETLGKSLERRMEKKDNIKRKPVDLEALFNRPTTA